MPEKKKAVTKKKPRQAVRESFTYSMAEGKAEKSRKFRHQSANSRTLLTESQLPLVKVLEKYRPGTAPSIRERMSNSHGMTDDNYLSNQSGKCRDGILLKKRNRIPNSANLRRGKVLFRLG